MDQNEILLPLAIFGGAALFWYVIIKFISDYLLKRKMIDKGYVTDETQALFNNENKKVNKYSSLKWGLIILSAGLALIVLEYIPYKENSPLPFGVFAVFVAGGFLTYYQLIKKETN